MSNKDIAKLIKNIKDLVSAPENEGLQLVISSGKLVVNTPTTEEPTTTTEEPTTTTA
jgi:hypothetical protein